MIDMASVVKLAPRARLRFDRHSQKHMLLYPEHGIELSGTAAEVITRCAEGSSVASIVEQLVQKYGDESRGAIAIDVIELLQGLADRGLVEEVRK